MTASGGARRQRYSCLAALACLLACGPGGGGSAGEGGAEPEARAGARAGQARAEAESPAPMGVVLFLGTSLTAGYGLTQDEAYPARVQEHIDAAGLPFRVVNAGVSGDTSAGGLRRLDWLLRQPVAVLVLELGANDMLRGLGIEAMRGNLQEIVDRTRAEHPGVRLVVAGMRAAPNLGEGYGAGFEASYPELAEKNGGVLIPFLLDGVAADPELNQADGIHPTAEGQRIVAGTVWGVLEPILQEAIQGSSLRG